MPVIRASSICDIFLAFFSFEIFSPKVIKQRQKLFPLLSKQELEVIYTHHEIPTSAHKKSKCNWFKTYQLAKQRNKAVLSLLINQGLTTPEVAKLTLSDLKLKEGKIYIAGSRKISSTKAYLVNQTEDLQKDIDQYHPF